jgi:uncharacterized membrane protein HdeD (DUF308 family)
MNMYPQSWWLWILRAATTALFTLIAILYPPLNTVLALHLYGAYVNLDGFSLVALHAANRNDRAWLVYAAVVAWVSALTVLLGSAPERFSLTFVLAALAMARGVLEGIDARQLNPSRERTLRLLTAVLITGFGALLSAYRMVDLRTLVVCFGLYGAICSLGQLGVGLEIHRQGSRAQPRSSRGARVPTIPKRIPA